MDEKKVIERIYESSPVGFKAQIGKAISLSNQLYGSLYRYSGQSEYMNRLEVAQIVAEMGLDTNSIIAALLSNKSLRSESYRREKYQNLFSERWDDDVWGLLVKIEDITESTKIESSNPELISRFIISHNQDIRPILIKIASTLVSSRTIDALPEAKIRHNARFKLNVWVPLCEYLDLPEYKQEIEDNCFKILYPDQFENIDRQLSRFEVSFAQKVDIENILIRLCLRRLKYNPKIFGRLKSRYSIFKKLKKYLREEKIPSINQVRDIYAYSIIVRTENDCFNVVEALRNHMLSDEEMFDNYINSPKANGFSQLQMALYYPEITDIPFEVQIMTHEMYYTNTYGTASHIAYKASKSRFASPSDAYSWVESIHQSMQKHKVDRETKLSCPIDADVFRDQIFAFTPKKRIIILKDGACCLDFAYRVHTDLGHSAIAATLNGKKTNLKTLVKTGDIVEIIRDEKKGFPNSSWLNYDITEKTRSKIKKGLKRKGF